MSMYVSVFVCERCALAGAFSDKVGCHLASCETLNLSTKSLLLFFLCFFELIVRTVRDFRFVHKKEKKTATDLLSFECQMAVFIAIYYNFIGYLSTENNSKNL